MIRLEPKIKHLRDTGIELGFDVDWWRQTDRLLVVDFTAWAAVIEGVQMRLRIGWER